MFPACALITHACYFPSQGKDNFPSLGESQNLRTPPRDNAGNTNSNNDSIYENHLTGQPSQAVGPLYVTRATRNEPQSQASALYVTRAARNEQLRNAQ
jgi:hypothetical protein